jgi:anti-anti-sigma factor
MAIVTEKSSDNKTLTIKVQGRFDFSMLQSFKNAYESIEPIPESFVIDLKESDYLDSSALGMLLALRDHAGGDDSSNKIKIKNCNSDVKKILVITKLDELFSIE